MPVAVELTAINHVGIRVKELARSAEFYRRLGFELCWHSEAHRVAGLRNPAGIELNLILNGDDANGGKNVLMDVGEKYPGYTHLAFRVASIKAVIEMLRAHNIRITQGPVSFGRDGHVSVFVRDPDLNVVELRGRNEDLSSIGGVVEYVPEN